MAERKVAVGPVQRKAIRNQQSFDRQLKHLTTLNRSTDVHILRSAFTCVYENSMHKIKRCICINFIYKVRQYPKLRTNPQRTITNSATVLATIVCT